MRTKLLLRSPVTKVNIGRRDRLHNRVSSPGPPRLLNSVLDTRIRFSSLPSWEGREKSYVVHKIKRDRKRKSRRAWFYDNKHACTTSENQEPFAKRTSAARAGRTSDFRFSLTLALSVRKSYSLLNMPARRCTLHTQYLLLKKL